MANPSKEGKTKLIALSLSATLVGFVSISLGVTGTFTFVSCGTITCIPVYSIDILATILGAILLFVGGFKLLRTLHDSSV